VTALCGGGTSQVKSGLDAFVTYSAGAIALMLQQRGGSKLLPLIPLLGLAPLELSNLCSTDPPALPTFTEDEVFSLLLLRLDSDYFSGLAKFRDLITRMIWYEACECTTGSPTAYVPPTLPTNTPDPVDPVLPVNTACDDGGTHTVVTPSGNFVVSTTQPVTYMVVTLVNTIVSGGGQGLQVSIGQWYVPPGGAFSSGTLLTSTTIVSNQGLTDVKVIPVTPGARMFRPDFVAITPNGSSTVTCRIQFYCGSAPPGAQPMPCCPPDASTQAYLNSILSMVTLIQRQAVPFSYVYGANHTSLSGHGSLAVSGLIGCSVDVTTLPDSYGRAEGSPERLFDLGFVTLGTADGYERSRRIDADGTLFIPPSSGLYTAIGYTLSPGVVASIRELVREP
jgi:hypothetical protein